MLALALAALLVQQPETLSLLGEQLHPYTLSKSARSKADDDLRVAHAAYQKAPNDIANVLALARAHLAFARVGDAIEVLTHGLEVNTDDPQLLQERGRGYIVIRKFDIAQRDLRKAAERLPEAHCDLGLAQYLAGAYSEAAASYRQCKDPGILAYLAARRAGQTSEPPPLVKPEPRQEEIRFPGSPRKPIKDAPLMTEYFDAVDALLTGSDESVARLKTIVQRHRKNEWMEPAYIAAEADYARVYKPPRKKKK